MVSIETWMLVASNVLVFLISISLIVMSYRAQRRLENKKLRYTTLGFALVTATHSSRHGTPRDSST